MNKKISLITEAKRKAENGVDYSAKDGAICPYCGTKKLKIYSGRKWEGNIKIRYHKCHNESCILNKINITIKSIQSVDK